MFLFISGPEIGFVIFIVVLLFGTEKIPDLARGLAKGINSVKNASREIKKEISDTKDQLDVDVTKKISSEIEKAKSEVDSLTGSIKRDL